MEDILKDFDESIERDESAAGPAGQAEEPAGAGTAGQAEAGEGEVPQEAEAEDAGCAGAEAQADDAGEAGADQTEDAGEADAESADDAEEDSGDADEESSGKKKDGFFSKKKKKSSRLLEKELDKAAAKAAEMTDRYQRLMAEFENARKRMDKEKGQMFDIGAKSVLEKLLPVVDNFERGLSALSEEEKNDPFAQGVEKIYQQLMTVLTDVGVTAMDATGKEFNPDLHNAVMHVEDEELPENVVVEELQKGYMYKDSVLRYSMVKVAN